MDNEYIKNKLIANLQNYLRERMDFIASLPTMDPLWTAQFDIIDNLINPILDDIKDERLNPLMKCPNLFLLFDGILRSEGIRAGGIVLEIKIFKSDSLEPEKPDYTWTSEFKVNDSQIRYEINKEGNETEFPIAISLGTSGIQALYGILENIIRNSGRHSNKEEIKKVVKFSELIEGISRKKLKRENNLNQLQDSTSIIYKPENRTGFYKIEINDQKETKYFYHNKNQQEQKIEIYPLKITIEFYYNWGDNFKENKDDFIRVRIYDNMGGWIKDGSNNWVKKENENFSLKQVEYMLKPEVEEFGNVERDGRIINESGNIVQGNWGMKEMRICASFLRGIKISDYETQHKPPVITAVAVPKKENANEASLGFEFYIPKVKNLLIVSKNLDSEINKKEDLKKIGIYIEKDISKIIDLQNRGVFTHEFVAIDVDDKENKKFIQENSLLLPYKLFFISGQNKNLDEIINLFKEIRYDLYIKNSISDSEKKNLKNLIISKDELQQWLTQNGNFTINNVQYQNCPPAERVYLEICKRWNIYIHKSASLPKDGIYFIKKVEDNLFFSDLKLPSEKLSEDFLNNCKNNILLLHRYDRFNEIKEKEPLAIIPFAHGKSDPLTRTKEEISNKIQNNQFDFAYIKDYFSIVEIGSCNIIIIDERIFDEAKKIRNICGCDVNFAVSWYLQNVAIFNLDKGTDDKSFNLTCYKIGPKGELNQTLDKPYEITFGNSSSKNEFSQCLPEHFKNKVHFMIIHQNIISPKIGGKEKFKEFINSLPDEYKPWYVIITSGRGHPSQNEMPENTKFLDFSTLRSVVIDRPDKFLLTKILSGLKEARG
jgi:hypothetical protein